VMAGASMTRGVGEPLSWKAEVGSIS
jgi:hypothetical protein